MSARWWTGLPWTVVIALFGLSIAISIAIVAAMLRPVQRSILHEAMLRMGLPVCPRCRYDLRDFVVNPGSPRCPECGGTLNEEIFHAIEMRRPNPPNDA